MAAVPVAGAAEWAPVPGHIMTPWTKDASPQNALPEYPRPQMVRKDWLNLNGLWDLAITKKDDPASPCSNNKIQAEILDVCDRRSINK